MKDLGSSFPTRGINLEAERALTGSFPLDVNTPAWRAQAAIKKHWSDNPDGVRDATRLWIRAHVTEYCVQSSVEVEKLHWAAAEQYGRVAGIHGTAAEYILHIFTLLQPSRT